MSAIFVFLCGAVLLVFSAEKLVGYLGAMASGLKMSVFFLALVFTGIEFDDVVLGLTLNAEELKGVALGTVFGTAISFSGVVLALACLVAPKRFDVPRDYVACFAIAPLAMLGFTLAGALTRVTGGILVVIFLGFVGYVAVRERRRRRAGDLDPLHYQPVAAGVPGGGIPVGPERGGAYLHEAGSDAAAVLQPLGAGSRTSALGAPLRAERTLPAGASLGLAVLSLAGLVAGAAIVSAGTGRILDTYGLNGTVFGATLATAVLSAGDVFLTVEPFRKGVPEIGIANVIGSLVFSVTGKLGVILLAGRITVGPSVLRWHLPALLAVTAVAAGVLAAGKLKRWHGCVLLGLYAAYWIVSYVLFGGAPIDSD